MSSMHQNRFFQYTRPLKHAIDHLLLLHCLSCNDLIPGPLAVCLLCQNTLPRLIHVCTPCSAPLPLTYPHTCCPKCLIHPPPFMRVFAAHPYTPPISTWIIRMKAEHSRALARQLGLLVARSLRDHEMITQPASTVLIPIPMHPQRLRQMGFNHTEVIASMLAKQYGLVINRKLVYRHRYIRRQTGASLGQRHTQIRRAFGVNTQPISPYTRLILIDDVVTSLGTITAVSHCLKQFYPSCPLEVWSVARTFPQIKPSASLSQSIKTSV